MIINIVECLIMHLFYFKGVKRAGKKAAKKTTKAKK